MYIRTELIKKFNELFYTTSAIKDFKPLNTKKIEDMQYVKSYMKEFLKVLDSSNISKKSYNVEELRDIAEDLVNNISALDDYKSNEGLLTALQVMSLIRDIKSEFLKPKSKTFTKLTKILAKHSNKSCLVGGCVRDACLGKSPKDYDLVTDIPYLELAEILSKEGFSVKEEGKAFLVLIVSKNKEQYEIANYRKDGTYTDGRRPDEVSINTLEEDAQRRDFTINALYYSLKDENLIDPTGKGIKDILEKKIRFVGKPSDRLAEDTERAWRLIRFTNNLKDFAPDKKSLKAVKSMWSDLYTNSNPQRVLAELMKMVDNF